MACCTTCGPLTRCVPASGLGELGDFRRDLVEALSVPLGRQRAEQSVVEFEDLVRKRAEEGANRAVKRGVLIVGAIVVGVPVLRRVFGR